MRSDDYAQKADRQYVRPNSSIFNRGSISFSTKDGSIIDAATLQTGYNVTINPSTLKEPADVFNNLSFILELDENDFFKSADKTEDPYEEIFKRATPSDAEKIKEMDIDGVSLYKDRWRFYPGKSLGSHVLGFMSYKGDELRGQYGLERQYNEVLDKSHNSLYANFFIEIFSGVGNSLKGKDSSGSIITTIEPTVQTFVEKEIDNVRSNWSAKKTGVIVMNPKNGEIYSMALNPTFDLNTFNEVDDIAIYKNDLVESVYEMGSIVKPLTMAIGLDTNSVIAGTTYEDRGQLTLNNRTFYNYDGKARGVVSMQDVLNNSLNTGVAFVVSRVGNNVFSDYMKKLIGNTTDIDLPNEASPLVSNLDSPRDIEHATASFGQGIAMSPISITRALASLGNGGLLIHPHVVKSIKYDLGYTKEVDEREPIRIFSEETSEEISRMLVTVVDDALLGGTVALPNYTIAAKTGTAQIANGRGGYYDDRYLHSFFGYFPAYDPEFIVFLYVIELYGVQYASQTLTEPFMNIAKFLINYYEVPPDR
ncbi:penicillin-binding protein 2 [Candidatus Nomurabacteria bacterium]|nr:penicillin-binding protein 2 [Candidatus Nomurabacteria bacterium]